MPLWYETEKPMDRPEDLQRQAALLEKAADFSNEEWCQGASAQDAAGGEVWHGSKAAAKRCLLARLDNTVRQLEQPPVLEMLLRKRLLAQLEGPESPLAEINPHRLVEWNDHPERTPEEVRQLLRDTAQALRRQAEIAVPITS